MNLFRSEEHVARWLGGREPGATISVNKLAELALVEGHVRLTAYAAFPEYLPAELELYLGTSPTIADWSEF